MRGGTERRLRRDVASRAGCEPGGTADTWCAYCGVNAYADWTEAEPTFWAVTGYAEEVGAFCLVEQAHLDHVIPESRNGPTSLDNTVIACAPCNIAKGVSPLGDPGFLEWLRERRERLLEAAR